MQTRINGFLSRFNVRLTDRVIILTIIACAFLPAVLSLLSLAIIAAALLIIKRTRRIVLSSRLTLWLIPLAPLSVIPPIVHRNYIGVVSGVGLVLLMILMSYMSETMTSDIFERATRLACGASVIAMFAAIFERIAYAIWPHLSQNKDLRCMSVFYNPNLFGSVIVFVILMCLYKILSHRGNVRIYSAIIACNLISMALCGSMLGMAELVVGVFFLLLFNRRWAIVGVFAAVAAVGVGALAIYPQLLPRLFEASESFNLRVRVWQLALVMFREAPVFGRGILSYMTFSPDYVGADLGFKVWVTTCAHSLLLDALICLGIVGACVITAYLVRLIVPAVKNHIRRSDRAVTALALAATAAALFHGLMDETVAWPQVTVLFFLLLAGAAACGREKQN